MGGDSNPRCLSAHTLSRRAQSTALSPIQVLHTLTANLLYGKLTASLCCSRRPASDVTECKLGQRHASHREAATTPSSERASTGSQLQAPEQFVER